MENPQDKVFKVLNALNIKYRLIKHPAAFTIEDMDKLDMNQYGDVCKNLFLRDAKGKRHFLVVLDKDKKVDLKSVQSNWVAQD